MPAFWNDPFVLFPKQQHRWVVTFENDSRFSSLPITSRITTDKKPRFYIPPHFIKSVDRPNFEIGSIQAKYLFSHTFNFPKRLTWKPITISFNDVLERKQGSFIEREDGSTEVIRKNLQGESVTTRPALNMSKNREYDGKSSSWEIIKSTKAGNSFPENLNILNDDVDGLGLYRRSTQNMLFRLLQIMGYFSPDELNIYNASDAAKTDQLLRLRNYTFKRNMNKALTSQPVEKMISSVYMN